MAVGGVLVVRRRDGRAVDRRRLFCLVASARTVHQTAAILRPVSAACLVARGRFHSERSHQELLRGYPD
jgi:hypothetical protein